MRERKKKVGVVGGKRLVVEKWQRGMTPAPKGEKREKRLEGVPAGCGAGSGWVFGVRRQDQNLEQALARNGRRGFAFQ